MFNVDAVWCLWNVKVNVECECGILTPWCAVSDRTRKLRLSWHRVFFPSFIFSLPYLLHLLFIVVVIS